MVGNTTLGFLAASMASVLLGGVFMWLSQSAPFALGAAFIPYFAFGAYFFGTWSYVAKNPDPAMTADDDYTRLIEARVLAARDSSILPPDDMPMIATTAGYVPVGAGAADHG